jgi:hypothetical protein
MLFFMKEYPAIQLREQIRSDTSLSASLVPSLRIYNLNSVIDTHYPSKINHINIYFYS